MAVKRTLHLLIRVTAGYASSPKGKRFGFVELVSHSDIFF